MTPALQANMNLIFAHIQGLLVIIRVVIAGPTPTCQHMVLLNGIIANATLDSTRQVLYVPHARQHALQANTRQGHAPQIQTLHAQAVRLGGIRWQLHPNAHAALREPII